MDNKMEQGDNAITKFYTPHFIERKTVEYKKAPSGAFLYFLYFI